MKATRRWLPKLLLTRWAAMFYWALPGVNLYAHVVLGRTRRMG